MDLWHLALVVLVLLSFGVVFFGAPFVPTKRKDIELAFDLAKLTPGDLVVDLGSGDGRVLQAAAAKGYRGLGYELSPIFALISRVRLWPYRSRTDIMIRNFWHQKLPVDTAVIFVFLAGPFMKRLSAYLQQQANEQQRTLILISNGFELPGYVSDGKAGTLRRYTIKPIATSKA